MIKTKYNLKLKDLENIGFKEEWFGLYGPLDYIPEYYYIKNFNNSKYYIETNHYYIDELSGNLKYFRLFKRKHNFKGYKELKFSKIYKVVRQLLKELDKLEQVKESYKGE